MSSALDKNASIMTIVLDKIAKFKYFCKISRYFLLLEQFLLYNIEPGVILTAHNSGKQAGING